MPTATATSPAASDLRRSTSLLSSGDRSFVFVAIARPWSPVGLQSAVCSVASRFRAAGLDKWAGGGQFRCKCLIAMTTYLIGIWEMPDS